MRNDKDYIFLLLTQACIVICRKTYNDVVENDYFQASFHNYHYIVYFQMVTQKQMCTLSMLFVFFHACATFSELPYYDNYYINCIKGRLCPPFRWDPRGKNPGDPVTPWKSEPDQIGTTYNWNYFRRASKNLGF